jgi:hypothetical protein
MYGVVSSTFVPVRKLIPPPMMVSNVTSSTTSALTSPVPVRMTPWDAAGTKLTRLYMLPRLVWNHPLTIETAAPELLETPVPATKLPTNCGAVPTTLSDTEASALAAYT